MAETYTFGDSAQSPSATITLSALAASTGRVSAQLDRGSGFAPAWFTWRFNYGLNGSNIVGASVGLYLATSDGTSVDGAVGTADAAVSTVEFLRALQLVGSTSVYQTTTNTKMTHSGYLFVPWRYISAAVWNFTTLPFQNSTSVHQLILTSFDMP